MYHGSVSVEQIARVVWCV